jgi:hypothetical protein
VFLNLKVGDSSEGACKRGQRAFHGSPSKNPEIGNLSIFNIEIVFGTLKLYLTNYGQNPYLWTFETLGCWLSLSAVGGYPEQKNF